MDFVETQAATYSDLSEAYTNLGLLFQRKLWHQLTDALETFVNDPASSRGDNLLQLYEKFITAFETRLSQLRLIRIVSKICQQFYPSRPYVSAELERAIHLFDMLKEKRGRLGEEAYLVCATERLSLVVKQATVNPDVAAREASLEAVKTELEECRTLLDSFVDVQPVAAATVYRVSAEYHAVRGPAAEYYRNALQFLAHTPLEGIPEAEQQAMAVNIAVSALVGTKVFNFGEIVEHPVMASLAGTPHEWLRAMLRVFHTGNIDGFNSLVASNRAAYESQPALAAADETIKEKVAIVCVMELASQRPATDRSITFSDIAAATRLPVEKVEWLLMRAMSFGLIKGVIDEADQVVHVSFIKPRVMDMSQIATLRERIGTWSESVKETLLYMEDNTHDIFT